MADEMRKRERQAAAVRKLASLFAKADGSGGSAAQQDERRTLELIRSVTSEAEVTAVIDHRLEQLEAIATTAGGDAGQAYARILAADSKNAANVPVGATSALRWLVDHHLPGRVEDGRVAQQTSPLNSELLTPQFWLRLSATVNVRVCGESGDTATHAAAPLDIMESVPSSGVPSSGVPFGIAAATSFAAHQLVPTPHLPWLGAILAVGAAILGPRHQQGAQLGDGSLESSVRVDAAEAERVVDALRGPGYAIAHSPSWGGAGLSNLGTVQMLMRQLKSSGWPAAFCFVFDEAWELLAGMWGVAEQVLGPDCVLEPSVFAWALDPAAAKRAEESDTATSSTARGVTGKRGYIGGNFGLPHRDFSYDEAYGSEAAGTTGAPHPAPTSFRRESCGQLPRVLSTWMPLTPVRTDNGCMYVVPAEFDSCFDKSGAFSHLRAATARVDEDEDTVAGSILTECRFDLTAARPLAPAEPGDVCMWAGNSIHWCLLTVNNYTFDPVSSCKQTEHFASADRGARASADSAAPPRSSIAVTFCRADVKSVHDVSGDQLLTRERAMRLSLAERLSLIARSLLMHQQWYDLDAGLPPSLLSANATSLDGSTAATSGREAQSHEENTGAQGTRKADAPNQTEVEQMLPKEEGKHWLEAAKAGELERLQEMLRGWVDDTGGNAATILCSQGKGTSYSFTGHTALHWVSAKGHLDCVTWLLAEGSKAGLELVSCTNHSDATPLHSAAANGRAEVVTLLLEAGADSALKDDCNETPLDIAKRFGREEVIELLSK